MEIENRYLADKYLIRRNLLKYTRQAFGILPKLERPHILDIGCGSGVPTLELARLCDGEIVGIDIDEELLDVLRREADKAGLSKRIKALKCSVTDIEFSDRSFDIIWSEGSVFVVGFENGLRDWKRLLKHNGFMVIHDAKGDVEEKLELISRYGYHLLGYLVLDGNTWWREYYAPLEKLVNDTVNGCSDSVIMAGIVDSDRREIEMFRENPEVNSSVIFVMKRND